jgi:hypothetical protein
VVVFVTDAPAERAPTISPHSKSDKYPIFLFFHTHGHPTQSIVHWHEHYRVWTNGRRTFSFANWNSFNVANTNSIPQFLCVSIVLSTPCIFMEL